MPAAAEVLISLRIMTPPRAMRSGALVVASCRKRQCDRRHKMAVLTPRGPEFRGDIGRVSLALGPSVRWPPVIAKPEAGGREKRRDEAANRGGIGTIATGLPRRKRGTSRICP